MDVDFSYNPLGMSTKYHYVVSIFVTTFEDASKNYSHDEIFDGGDLLDSRSKAVLYYNEQLQAIAKKGKLYDLPFASPEEFEQGKNAAYSVDLLFVTDDGINSIFETLSGEGDKDQTLLVLTDEAVTLVQYGYPLEDIPLLLFDGVTAPELQEAINKLLNDYKQRKSPDDELDS